VTDDASVHYFPLLVELLRCLDAEDTPELGGGKLLVFLDEAGKQVTVRLSRTAFHSLSQTLANLANEGQA
jgi:hypothetical protein